MLRLKLEFERKPSKYIVKARSWTLSCGDSAFTWKPSWVKSKTLQCYVFLWFGLIIWNRTIYTGSPPLSDEERKKIDLILTNEEE